ncbi:MAG: Hsp20/alpha crystallin family protein [Candidatus Promineifilaceae bacterium]|nr:Hsp20/alpha crystallin family protein [Candidatus Promineifilaceae bacterium]
MNALTRWNSYREMLNLRDQMDRLFEDTFSLFPSTQTRFQTPRIWGLDMDVSETDEAYIVKVAVPGITPEELDITLTNNVLTIKGELESAEEQEEEGEVYHMRELRYGSFSRSLTLPERVNADDVEAHVENGILTVFIPKSEESKPKQIPVDSDQKAIEGELA